ncbi:MAG TPA: hypothetical protein VET86_04995 [Casimicrobiaceae bacterium]|nr:hypothetical protein [Casimicrobiaceae bacterium]
MGLFDRIFGDAPRQPAAPAPSDDEQAIARYRYMLRTAPPEAIEQAHEEAFARLTTEQRRQVLEQIKVAAPEGARDGAPVLSDPQALARYATRSEIRQPGTLERTFGAMPAAGGPGIGGMIASSLLGSMAGTVLGTAVAQEFMGHHPGMELPTFDAPHAADPFTDASILDAIDGVASDAGGDLDLPDTFDV